MGELSRIRVDLEETLQAIVDGEPREEILRGSVVAARLDPGERTPERRAMLLAAHGKGDATVQKSTGSPANDRVAGVARQPVGTAFD